MKRRDVIRAFDWYFTDISQRDSARYETLRRKPRETSMLLRLISADSMVSFALWSELPKNHPVAELWFETQTDLLATIYLAYGGFFRQALSIVRSWFEISIDGVFFSAHYGQPRGRYEQWKLGQRNAPANMRIIAQSLSTRPQTGRHVSESTFVGKLEPIYSFLSDHTHGQGIQVYKLQDGRDNVPRYIPKSFDMWYRKVVESFDAICFLYGIFFPTEIASYLKKSKGEIARIRALSRALSQELPEFAKLASKVSALV
jgi:hypothetical protein